jgi:hypothetical protein
MNNEKMSKLPALATARKSGNGETRICNVRTPAALRVLSATARLWEIRAGRAKNHRNAGGISGKAGEKA